ncbi:MAG: hypothetical protein JNM83_05600 [Myxococcales bacterium]|nr:hypothetical protein [Myxococcales bacterium]
MKLHPNDPGAANILATDRCVEFTSSEPQPGDRGLRCAKVGRSQREPFHASATASGRTEARAVATDVGTIAANVGTVAANVGTIAANVGTIAANVGTVASNDYAVSTKHNAIATKNEPIAEINAIAKV